MAVKLTILIDDYEPGEMDEDPLASAVSNLEYDGFNVLQYAIDNFVPDKLEEN